MFKRYKIAFLIAFLIACISGILVFVLFYAYTQSTQELINAWPYGLAGIFILTIFVFFTLQYRIESFILTKVRDLYKDISPTGIPLNEDSLKRDVRSITESIQRFAKESKLEIELLKDKENFRREFIGNLAHEIKTPLFTVQGYIYTLIDGEIKDKKIQKKYLKKAANGIDRLNVIVNDLDFITQIERGITTLEVEQFDIISLIHDMLELLEIQAEKKEINLVCNYPRNEPLFVDADMERIGQVLTNLVVNSLKYGVENGTTEIDISSLSDTKILVRIIDNGRGIGEEHLPRLFERFYRVENSRNRNDGGSGLGLAIVKHIIEAHNEKIFVESTENVGSEFSFTLTRSANK